MKQETSAKKKKLWLWILLAVVALLAVVGVVLALVLGGGQGKQNDKIQSELYWNVDRLDMVDEDTGLSDRPKTQNGDFLIRFATGGKQVELPVADKKLVNVIDTMDIMGLKLDAEGYIIDVYAPEEFCSKVVDQVFVQKIEGNTVTVNSSIAFNGMQTVLTLDEDLGMYNVSPRASMCGQKDSLQIMDTITIYGPDEKTPDEVFILDRIRDSEAYWRVEQQYDSANKMSAREQAEDGFWYVDFAVRGKQVTLRTEIQEVINAIDGYGIMRACCGLEFNDQGDIIDCFGADLAKRGVYTADGYDITELSEDGKTFTATRITFNAEVGKTYTGTVSEETEIYNVNSTADMIGEVTDLQMGDRIIAVADGNGQPVLIYVLNRRVDGPLYYNVSRSYSTGLKQTTRKPDANGWYTIKLAANGKEVTYKTRDLEIVNKLDSYGYAIFGLKVENGIIVKVYDAVCVTGNYSFGANAFVTSIAGPIISTTAIDGTVANGVMSADCEVYDMSGNGAFRGVKTELREGDRIIGYTNPEGEIVYIAIINRYEAGTTMYWNLQRSGVSNGKTTRVKDENGYYNFKVVKVGTTTVSTVRTKSDDIAYRMDSQSTPPAFALRLSGSTVTAAYAPECAIGGYRTLNYVHIDGAGEEEGTWACSARTTGATATFRPVEDVTKYYNFSGVYNNKAGEWASLRVDDQISCIANPQGQVEYCFVVLRNTNTKLYFNSARKWDAVKEETTRKPDANGYYVFELAVDGQVKTFRTKSKELASAVDQNALAFGLKVSGDIIQQVYPAAAAYDVKQSAGGSYYDVERISGNTVYLKRNRPGQTDTGKTATITLASNCKVYNVSPNSGDKWGTATKLKVGDRIHGYIDDNDKVTYIYVMYECTREDGPYGYCPHCGETVWWENWFAGTQYKTDVHYFMPYDQSTNSTPKYLITNGDNGETFDYVLDLNGRTLTRTATDGAGSNGLIQVGSGNSLTILDCSSKPGTIQTDRTGITYNANASTALLQVGEKSTLTIDGNITVDASTAISTYTKANGGAITVGGKLVINSGTFYGYKEFAGNGGFIGGWNGSEIVINGGTFYPGASKIDKEGKAVGNGGVITTNGTLTITGGKFIGPGKDDAKQVKFGGLINCNGPWMTITGGTFSGGNATGGWGPNIYYYRQCKINGKDTVGGGTVTIGGNADIAGALTIRSDKAGNPVKIIAKGQSTVDLSKEDAALARWYNYRVENGDIYLNNESTPRKSATTIANFSVLKNCKGNVFQVVDGVSNKTLHNYNGDRVCDDCGWDLDVYHDWTKSDALPTEEGKWRLTKNITVTGQTTPEGDLLIDLNGFDITLKPTADEGKVSNTCLYYVKGTKLTILDSSNDTTGGEPGTVSAVYPEGAVLATHTALLCGADAGSQIELQDGIYDASNLESVLGNTNGAIVTGGKLTVSGDTTVIKGLNKTAGNGTAIGGWGGSQITIDGGTFYGGETKNTTSGLGQGAVISTNGNLTINGGTFHGANAKHGGVLYMGSGAATLTVTGGTFHGGTVSSYGAVLNCGSATAKISGGTFNAGKAAYGGVLFGTGNINISGGTFNGNATAITNSGGLIKVQGSGTLTVTGGTFQGGNATNGDSIYCDTDSTTVKLGGNASFDGGVYLSNFKEASLSGTVKIGEGDEYGYKLASGKTVDVSGLQAGAKVYVDATGVFTAELGTAEAAQKLIDDGILVSGDSTKELTVSGKAIQMAAPASAEPVDINNAAWKDWTSDNSLPTSGKYRLTKSITLSAAYELTGDLMLDLNGQTVTQTAANYAIATKGFDLTVEDNSGKKEAELGTIKTTATSLNALASVIYAGAESQVVLNNGIIDGSAVENTSTAAASGAITLGNNASLTVNGGIIKGQKSSSSTTGQGGSCVGAMNGANVTVNGGKLIACDTNSSSGYTCASGSCINAGTGTITITGGQLQGRNAQNHGTTVYTKGALNISGGLIQGGYNWNSGNIYCEGTMTVTGGTIVDGAAGNANQNGANIDKVGGTLTIGGDAVIGGGINLRSGAKLVLKDKPVINSNLQSEKHFDIKIKANSTGSIYLNSATGTPIANTAGSKYKLTYGTDGKVTGVAAYALPTNWSTADSLPTSGNIKLTTDVTVSSLVTLTGNLTIDLNGHSITRTAQATDTNKHVFEARTGKTLILTDSSATPGTVKVGSEITTENYAGLIYVTDNASLVVKNITLDGSNVTSTKSDGGGAIMVGTNSNLTVVNATLKGLKKTAYRATVISGWGTSNVVIHGDNTVITPGETAGNGAAIATTGKITINGGTFNAGTHTGSNSSGEIYNNNSLTINGGTFNAPASGVKHAGVIYMDGGTLTVNGGTFHGGTVSSNGGIINSAGTVVINGGTFNAGKANQGGVLFQAGSSSLTITGGVFVGPGNVSAKGCTSGGLLALNVATVNITGGRFYNGYASGYGCNIYNLRTGGTMTLGGDAFINGEIRTVVQSGAKLKLVLKDSVKIDKTGAQPNTGRNLYLTGTDVYIGDTTGTAAATAALNASVKYNPVYDANGKITGVNTAS